MPPARLLALWFSFLVATALGSTDGGSYTESLHVRTLMDGRVDTRFVFDVRNVTLGQRGIITIHPSCPYGR